MPPTRRAAPDISASRPKSQAKPSGSSKPKSQGKAARNTQYDISDLSKESNRSNSFISLPLELKLQIVEYLPTRDIPNVRMISESWAAAGAPSMFRDGFTVRPYLDDMDRLGQVCLHPEIAKGIRLIKFFAGDTQKDLLVAAVNREEQRLSWASGGQLTKIWKQVDAIFDPERMQKHCEVGLLEKYLPSLSNLECLMVTSLECPFRGNETPFCIAWAALVDDYNEDDEEIVHFLDSRMSVERYSSIISAASKCNTINTLALDSFPIDCFRDPSQRSLNNCLHDALQPGPSLKARLSHITALQISIEGAATATDYTSDMGRKMAEFIGCFRNLSTLDLSYDESVDETDECLMGFEEVFYRFRFPHLHTLLIAGCDSDEMALGKFLFAHKNTLRRLCIGEAAITPEESSWKQILTDLRDHMSLEKFELYVPEAEGRIYDMYWNSVPSDGKARVKDAKLLELYVLGKCPWPMAESNPRGGGWKRKFGAEDMKLLDLPEEEMRDLLGEDWETDADSEDEDEDMEDDSTDDDTTDDESEAFFSMDGDHYFIDDETPVAGDGDWEDMEVDEADVQ